MSSGTFFFCTLVDGLRAMHAQKYSTLDIGFFTPAIINQYPDIKYQISLRLKFLSSYLTYLHAIEYFKRIFNQIDISSDTRWL